jgi:hypothetical protein
MLAIENFGRLWRRDKVHWGAGNNKGHLNGVRKGNKKSKPVNFRSQIGIYILFNVNRETVYVGQAGIGNARLFGRLKRHRVDHLKDRWTHFSWFGLRGVNEGNQKLSNFHKPETKIRNRNRKDALHETEAVLMSVVEPPLNKRGPNWQNSVEYIQSFDEVVPKDTPELISEIANRLKKVEIMIERATRK